MVYFYVTADDNHDDDDMPNYHVCLIHAAGIIILLSGI